MLSQTLVGAASARPSSCYVLFSTTKPLYDKNSSQGRIMTATVKARYSRPENSSPQREQAEPIHDRLKPMPFNIQRVADLLSDSAQPFDPF